MTALLPCRFCRYCVPEDATAGRCHRAEPVILRGSQDASWPKVFLDAPGCGKAKPHETEVSGG